MKEFDLCDSFSVEGTELAEFSEWVDRISQCTSVVRMQTNKMGLLPVIDGTVLAKVLSQYRAQNDIEPIDKRIYMPEIDKNQFFSPTLPTLKTISIDQVLKRGGSKELYEEARDASRLFIEYNNRLYFTSSSLYESLCARADLKGEAARDTSVEKVAFVMRRFEKKPQAVNVLVRTLSHGRISKVMAIGSQRYQYVPQSFFNSLIKNIYASMGESPACYKWSINQFISTIYLEFPMLAKRFQNKFTLRDTFIPGICLVSSDTHDASISACPTWRIGSSIVTGNSLYMKHSLKADIEDFFKDIKKNILLKYPDFLCRLSHFKEITVENPSLVLPHIYSALSIERAIGKRKDDMILRERLKLFTNQTSCSAYDLAVDILRLPGAYPAKGSPADKFRRAVYNTVYLKIDHFLYPRKSCEAERAG